MLGVHFDACQHLGLAFSFEGCQLTHSSFFKLKIKNTQFKNCILQEADFAEADLTNAVFSDSNLSGAIFDHTALEKSDFRGAYGYAIDPDINKIKKARFSLSGIPGLLTKYDIYIDK
jgi:uncharacterized protein YjbI with pentapeptide repeats